MTIINQRITIKWIYRNSILKSLIYKRYPVKIHNQNICIWIYQNIYNIDTHTFLCKFTFKIVSIYHKIQLCFKHSDLIDKYPFFMLLKQTAKTSIFNHKFLALSSANQLFYTEYLLHQTSEWCSPGHQVSKPCHNVCPVPKTVRRTEGSVY